MASRWQSTRGALYFSAGEFGANLTWNMISGFIMFYYSNVVLLPIAAVGTMLLLTRVLDAVIDPLIGVAVDRTRTRWGRARPYLIFATFPFVAITILAFSVPNLSLNHKLVYAYVTFTLAGILFSALYIPYNAMVPLITSDATEKLRISSFRAMAASAGSIVVYATMMPLVAALGGGDPRIGFSISSALMGVGTAAAMLLVFRTSRERPLDPMSVTHLSVRVTLSEMLRNRIWLIVAVFALLLLTRIGAMVSATAYFAVEVLHRPAAISWLLSSLSVSILIGGYLARPFLSRVGVRNGTLISIAIAIALAGVMALAQSQPWLLAGAYFLANISIGVQSATMFVLVADSVDMQERLFGHRAEGLLTSTVSFATKVGMAIGGAIVAYGLARVDYHPGAASVATVARIELLYLGVPALFAALQMVAISFYTPPPPAAA